MGYGKPSHCTTLERRDRREEGRTEGERKKGREGEGGRKNAELKSVGDGEKERRREGKKEGKEKKERGAMCNVIGQ
jgi:hypothetical protein